MDRTGAATPLRATPAGWESVQFAPDGRRLAMDISDGTQTDIWIYEWERDRTSRLTMDRNLDEWPTWTPDGERIAFASRRADKLTFNVYWQRADGTGEVQRLIESRNPQWPTSWHPNGRLLALSEQTPTNNEDILILPIDGDERSGWKPGKATVFVGGPSRERYAAFSPDGRWLAYASNESGRSEVYVRSYPDGNGPWQISTDDGILPTWSRTRSELFYSNSELQIMVVPYATTGEVFQPEKPRLMSERRFRRGRTGAGRSFDLHPDGNRLALAAVDETEAQTRRDKLVFIFNFFEELRRIAPGPAR
jgi:serine/threonine-protein kinase